jgi:hypothetical protein
MLVDIGDTRLRVGERGSGDPALIVLRGVPLRRPAYRAAVAEFLAGL